MSQTKPAAETTFALGNGSNSLTTGYEQLCKSHDAIDDFRSKLLALLPIASAGGIFLLVNKETGDENGVLEKFSTPIGIFGLVVTLGLFAYELFGIRKCHAIIGAAQGAEAKLGITGPFTVRPRELLGFINEPFAAGIIYPAVMAAWAFVGLHSLLAPSAGLIAGLVFLAGFTSTAYYNFWLKRDAKRGQLMRDLAALTERSVKMEQSGGQDAVAFFDPLLSDQLIFRRASGKVVGKSGPEGFLESLQKPGPFSARRPENVSVTMLDDRALVTLIVVGTQANDGSVHRYRNIRLFFRSGEKWVMELWYNYENTGA